MKIVVASGKGGTGKTTVAVALALALRKEVDRLQFLDCDVEEPNAELLLKPVLTESKPVTVSIPEVDSGKCTGCGRCREICEYNAVAVVSEKALIFENLCHACGGCRLVCPDDAITEKAKVIGRIDAGSRDNVHFLRGVLNVGEPMATPVIRALRGEATDDALTILDAPPGTACPVIATVKDCDYCILVTEPTPFGLYDLNLMVEVVKALGIPMGVVINKDDTWSTHIEEYASENDIPIVMKIPLSRDIAVFYSNGVPLNEADGHWDEDFLHLYEGIGRQIWQNQSK
ncbi:MAG: ATP-binding protein [Candidatus Eisenbacteria bacterium]